MTNTLTSLDTAAVEAFAGRVLTDFAGAAGTAMTVIGDRLGLYAALTGAGPTTADELAGRTGLHPRLVTEWLGAQTVSGYLATTRPPTPTSCPTSTPWRCRSSARPRIVIGAAEVVAGQYATLRHLEGAFRGDGGIDYHAFPRHGRARHRALLPHRLHPPARAALVPGRRRPGRTAGRRRAGGRRGLRARRRDPHHGPHLAAVGVRRVRRRRAVDHRRPIPGHRRGAQRRVPRGRGGRARARPVPGRDVLRRAARPRRPGRPPSAGPTSCWPRAGSWSWSSRGRPTGSRTASTTRSRASTTRSRPPCARRRRWRSPAAHGLGTGGGPTRRLRLLTEAGFAAARVAADTGQNLVLTATKPA